MLENIVRTLKQHSLSFNPKLSGEEAKILAESHLNSNSERTTVESYLKTFGIGTGGEKARETLSRISGDQNIFYRIMESLKRPKASLDEFLRYEVPEELVNVTKSRIDSLNSQVLAHYSNRFNNAHLLRNPDSFGRKLNKLIYDFAVFSYYKGTMWTVRDSVEIVKENLLKEYHDNKALIQNNTPNIVLSMLDAYLKFERHSINRPAIAGKPRLQHSSNPILGANRAEEIYPGLAGNQGAYSDNNHR